MTERIKIISTAYRVLYLLLLLNERNLSAKEILEVFSEDKYIEKEFSEELILKYIATLRHCGYEISRPCKDNNHTYELIKSPVFINFTEKDIKTLAEISSMVEKLNGEQLKEDFNAALIKISRFMQDEKRFLWVKLSSKNVKSSSPCFSDSSKQSEIIEKFEQCLKEDKRIILKYKTCCGEDSIWASLEPKEIKYSSHMTGLRGYNHISGEMQTISLSDIEEIEELPVKNKNSVSLSPVIFRLKSRLARGYRLYEDENIQNKDENEKTLTVVSYAEDKNLLLKRLLKYGDYCEILYPQSLREKAVSTINNALANYSIVD